MKCCSPHGRWNHKRNNQHRTNNTSQSWPQIFWNCSTCEHSENDTGQHRRKNGDRLTTDRSRMGSVMAGKGNRGCAPDFPRSTQSQTINEFKALSGQDRKEDRR